ncbi:MAG TPA: MFS transporter [Candidatus Kapabacteria bacterium]|nr:MFS transporter [Candidatus Kapabacteria bacterium]
MHENRSPDNILPSSDSGSLREGPLLTVLAVVQFTTMLDFLIMMPLGPQYMRLFGISPAQFGTIVSAYAISAGIAGLISGTFLDRLGRRQSLLVLYAGFGLATLACALAPGYLALTAARGLAGAFGGVSNAIILAIIGDVIPEERRGRAMGIVMSSFSLASVLGVPIGLYLANTISWHAPFFMLAFISVPVLAAAWIFVPHIKSKAIRLHENPVAHLVQIVTGPGHLRAFAFIGAVVLTGFMVIPYISPYMVRNVGLKETELPYIYLAGGLCTIFSMNIIGRLSDVVGKRRVFTVMAILAACATLLLTHLPAVRTSLAITVTTLFMICMSGRFVPAMAIMTSAVPKRLRGGFMGVSSAVQHMASGLGSFVGGLLLTESNGRLHHYGTIGYISACVTVVSLVLCYRLAPPAADSPAELLEPAT